MFPPSPAPDEDRGEPRDDYGDRFRRTDTVWADRFFRNTHMVLLVILSFCCSLVGLILGIIGVATCKDPDAKQRATVVLILSLIFMALGIISQAMQLGRVPLAR